MRLIVHGQQAFGKAVLEAVLERGTDEVVAVYCAPDSGPRTDPLKELAMEKGLPLFQPKSYKKPEVWEQIKGHDADLCVMAYVTLMVPEEALNAPKLGSIQYHPSLLPDHKGPSSINWPIIMGKKKTGLSIFWPDNGLDTGPILLQKECDIGPDDTLGSVYFNHLFPMGVAAMMESIELVRDGKAPRVDQDQNAGSYEGWCKQENAEIDWSQSTDTVHNLIRGCNPAPGAWTTLGGKPLKIFDCVRDTATHANPGTVISADDASFVVATNDGAVRVQRVQPAGEKKTPAGEWFSGTNALNVGDRLSS